MKKRLLLIALCLAMALTACMAACNKPAESKSTQPPVQTTAAPTTAKPTQAPTTQKPTEAPTTQKPTEAPTTQAPTEPEAEPTEPEVQPTEPVKPRPAETAIGSNPDYPNLPQKLLVVEQFLFGDTTENVEQRQLWVDTLSARYGVEIVLDVTPKAQTAEILQTRMAAGELVGMVYTYGWNYTFQWIAADAIYPLDDFLKNNATWNKLPEAMRKYHSSGGQIWAVPNKWETTSFGPDRATFMTQALRLDWMNKLGLEKTGMTMDVGTFQKYVMAFGDRADELGVTGKVVPIIFPGAEWGINPIMQAFNAGTYDPNTHRGYVFNPVTNCYEDALLNPGSKDAVLYIRRFYLGGYCPKSAFDSSSYGDARAILATGRVGAFSMYQGAYSEGGSTVNLIANRLYGHHDWNRIGDGYTAYKELQESTWYDFMLTGTKTKNLWSVSPTPGGWCLFKGTEQPEETVNFFVDLLFSSETTFFEARYNLLGVAYTKEADGTYTRNIFDDTTDPKTYYVMASLVGGFVEPELYPALRFDTYDFGVDKTITMHQRHARRSYANALTASAIAEERVVSLPAEYIAAMSASPSYMLYQNEIMAYQAVYLYDGFMHDVDINQHFETYKKNMRRVNGDQVLKEVNDAFGWVNDYQSYAAG